MKCVESSAISSLVARQRTTICWRLRVDLKKIHTEVHPKTKSGERVRESHLKSVSIGAEKLKNGATSSKTDVGRLCKGDKRSQVAWSAKMYEKRK